MSLNIKLRVNLQSIEIVEACPIVSGTVEEYNVEFEFSPYWNGYVKTAVIDVICGDPISDQLILDNSCTFSLGNAKKIRFGVYGVRGTRRLPTVYTRAILVKEGVQSSEGGQNINPTQYEQLVGIIGDTEKLETEDKSSLVAAINELLPTGGSGGTGENGATFIPFVSEDGIISWTNDKGLPNPDPVNIRGADAITDQSYDATSENAQSGKAVAEAINATVGDISISLDGIIELQENYISKSTLPSNEEVAE